tara:strand:- start:705 stop:995 length:291 start_codon:yes stop_codon:yes gene_type:complete
MPKLLKNPKQIIMMALLVALAYYVFRGCGGRKLFYMGSPIVIKEKGTKTVHDMPRSLECLDSAYYTPGLMAQGVCGGQKAVTDQASYELVSGIGTD